MSNETKPRIQLYDGTLKGALIGTSSTFVPESNLNYIIRRSSERGAIPDFGAINDRSINFPDAREVARHSGRLKDPPRLLFGARLSLPSANGMVPVEDELNPVLEIRDDIHREHRVEDRAFHYSVSPIMVALFVRTDPRVMEHIGDTWRNLILRTIHGLRVLRREGIQGILVTQSVQAHKESPRGYKHLVRAAIEEGVREVWVADTRGQEDTEMIPSSVYFLRRIARDEVSDVGIGFMGTGVNAFCYTDKAIQAGATSVYGVEKNLPGHQSYAEICQLLPLLSS